jgi:putative ABC transport system permease protein
MEIRALLSAMSRSKTGPLLVAAQVALTLAVLVNVAYVIQQRIADASRPTGLDLDNMFWVKTRASSTDYNYAAALKADLAYLNALPGVVAAATTSTLPQTFSNIGLPFSPDPHAFDLPNGGVPGSIFMGSEKFLDAMGLRLVAGRNFAPGTVMPPQADTAASLAAWAPEMMITQALAKKLFPDGHALGKTVYAGLINKPAVVVGIVDLMRTNPFPAQFDQFATQIVIVPILFSEGAYVVRTQPGRRDEIMAKIDKEFADLQPGRFVPRMEAYKVTAEKARSGYRASVIILVTVACFVLLVTVVGIVGLAAFNVATRTKQLGTRRAIGARKFHILRYFLVENWLTTTSGVVLGCILAVAAGVQLSNMYQMPRLPLYYLAGGVLLLWIVGLISVLVPAWRAASISPAVATRTV